MHARKKAVRPGRWVACSFGWARPVWFGRCQSRAACATRRWSSRNGYGNGPSRSPQRGCRAGRGSRTPRGVPASIAGRLTTVVEGRTPVEALHPRRRAGGRRAALVPPPLICPRDWPGWAEPEVGGPQLVRVPVLVPPRAHWLQGRVSLPQRLRAQWLQNGGPFRVRRLGSAMLAEPRCCCCRRTDCGPRRRFRRL
jgi:hypothetical protein